MAPYPSQDMAAVGRGQRSGLALVLGCSQTALQRAKVVGLTAKQTAETAYLTVRIEWALGHVDEEVMAWSLHARFELAQKAYVAALQLWENGAPQPDLETLCEQATAITAARHALALEVKSERPPAQRHHCPACERPPQPCRDGVDRRKTAAPLTVQGAPPCRRHSGMTR